MPTLCTWVPSKPPLIKTWQQDAQQVYKGKTLPNVFLWNLTLVSLSFNRFVIIIHVFVNQYCFSCNLIEKVLWQQKWVAFDHELKFVL